MKKNLFEMILESLAPTSCYFCSKNLGAVCAKCLKDNSKIISKSTSQGGADKSFYLANRFQNQKLHKMIDDLKLTSNTEIAFGLAEILAENIKNCADFADNFEKLIFIGAPTSEKHKRERGFCHTNLILKNLSKISGAKIGSEISRNGNLKQIGADKKQRHEQAEKSYFLAKKPEKGKIYVVFDDVRTTGATQNSICKILKNGGAEKVWTLAVLVQERNFN